MNRTRMKRIVSALMLAMIFHVGLFVFDLGQFFDDTVIRPRLTAVSVTMSYRQPEPVIEAKEKPPKPPEVKPRKKPKTPDKKKMTPPPEPEEIPIEPLNIPEPSETEPTQESETESDLEKAESIEEKADESEFMEDSHGDDVANMQVVQEAMPMYRKNPPIQYPKIAERRGYQGTVMLNVLVNEKGRAENLWVAESSGYRILDNAAIKAVKDWAFDPGTKANKKVSMWVKVPVRYQLK